MKHSHVVFGRLPLVCLLGANAIPLFGVLFFGWDVFGILLVYWSENVVVGFYNVLKIAFAKVKEPLGKLFIIVFFTIHFGIFTAVHGGFVFAMFGRGGAKSVKSVEMGLVVMALFISHGVSFVCNYLKKGEYARATLGTPMTTPYTRIFVMHIAIIAGGFILMALNSPAGLLLVLVVLKTFVDVKLHFFEHRKNGAAKAG